MGYRQSWLCWTARTLALSGGELFLRAVVLLRPTLSLLCVVFTLQLASPCSVFLMAACRALYIV